MVWWQNWRDDSSRMRENQRSKCMMSAKESYRKNSLWVIISCQDRLVTVCFSLWSSPFWFYTLSHVRALGVMLANKSFFPPLLSDSLPSSAFVLSMIWWCAVADVIEKLISTPIVFNAEGSEQIFPEFRDIASECTQPIPIYSST